MDGAAWTLHRLRDGLAYEIALTLMPAGKVRLDNTESVGMSVDEAIALAHALIIVANQKPGISYNGDLTSFKSDLERDQEFRELEQQRAELEQQRAELEQHGDD